MTLTDDGEAAGNATNQFRIDGNRLIYISEDSDNFIYVKLEEGAEFVLSEE